MSIYQSSTVNRLVVEISRKGKKFTKRFPLDQLEEAKEYEKYLVSILPPSQQPGRPRKIPPGKKLVKELRINGCRLIPDHSGGRCQPGTSCSHYDICLNRTLKETTWAGWSRIC
jgi:hypothetical protein